MKKIIKILIMSTLLILQMNVKAEELNYSEWSTLYPSGLDHLFIESEDRYNWYKIVNGEVEYVDEYYKELDGYIKDENSKKTFYRYITNEKIVTDRKNNILTEYSYCQKNACYVRIFKQPTMVDLSEKTESLYKDADYITINNEENPMTGDKTLIYFILMTISLILILIIIIRNYKKNKSSFVE